MCRKGEAVAGVIFREAETLQLRIRKITECHFPLILPLHSPQIIHGLVFSRQPCKRRQNDTAHPDGGYYPSFLTPFPRGSRWFFPFRQYHTGRCLFCSLNPPFLKIFCRKRRKAPGWTKFNRGQQKYNIAFSYIVLFIWKGIIAPYDILTFFE